MLQKIRTGDIDFMIMPDRQRGDRRARIGRAVGPLSLPFGTPVDQGDRRPPADRGGAGDVRRDRQRRLRAGARHARTSRSLRQAPLWPRSTTSRATRCVRPGDSDRAPTLPRLWGADRAYALFGSVYTSLQTGVVDFAENGVNVYDSNKHYEVAPVLPMTEHEANNSVIWVSDKLWASLSDEQKDWVQAAAAEVGLKQPAEA